MLLNLTKEQVERYGRYDGDPTLVQLAQYFHLDDADRALINLRRGDHNKLGFAVQLGTVRFLGTFLSDPTDVPPVVVRFICRQLKLLDPSCLAHYTARPVTPNEHVAEIKRRYGYSNFTDQPGHFRLVRWLYVRNWLTPEPPRMLFDLTTYNVKIN